MCVGRTRKTRGRATQRRGGKRGEGGCPRARQCAATAPRAGARRPRDSGRVWGLHPADRRVRGRVRQTQGEGRSRSLATLAVVLPRRRHDGVRGAVGVGLGTPDGASLACAPGRGGGRRGSRPCARVGDATIGMMPCLWHVGTASDPLLVVGTAAASRSVRRRAVGTAARCAADGVWRGVCTRHTHRGWGGRARRTPLGGTWSVVCGASARRGRRRRGAIAVVRATRGRGAEPTAAAPPRGRAGGAQAGTGGPRRARTRAGWRGGGRRRARLGSGAGQIVAGAFESRWCRPPWSVARGDARPRRLWPNRVGGASGGAVGSLLNSAARRVGTCLLSRRETGTCVWRPRRGFGGGARGSNDRPRRTVSDPMWWCARRWRERLAAIRRIRDWRQERVRALRLAIGGPLREQQHGRGSVVTSIVRGAIRRGWRAGVASASDVGCFLGDQCVR